MLICSIQHLRDGLTLDNMVTAIASFQRTLITNSSPFDRYAQGDFNALTPSQRRGFRHIS